MKKLIIFLVLVGILGGCTNSERANVDESLNFEIDIANLNYDLPDHTKICTPTRKQACGIDGCKSVKPSVFLAYNENENMIYRCDRNPCDGYEIKTSKSGIYEYIQSSEPRGLMVKISNDDLYTEVVSIGLETYISYGTCK